MVGIDIGSKSIKIVELIKSSAGWQVKSSGAVGYSGITPDKTQDQKELEPIAEIIKKVATQIKISTKDVCLGLPESLVFTRVIKFPLLSDEEVSAAVKWEAEQYIPIPIAEAVIQYVILERSEETAKTSVLLVAAPKNIVEKYVNVIKMAGLMPIAAETELTALARSMVSDKGVVMLLDLGSSATDMAIVRDGKIVFTRSIPVAAEAFTRAVSQSLGITIAQAEEYKKTYGLSPNQLEGKVRVALDPVLKMVVDEIKKAIHFYQTDEKGDAPSSIVVTGGASVMPGIVQYLTESLGVETVLGDPYSKLSIDPETLKNLAPYTSIYGAAVGLAMRDE